jgi:hypothetical protein
LPETEQDYRMELSLPFPPAFEALLKDFLRLPGKMEEEARGSLEEAIREAVYQMGPESGEGRCWISLRSAGGKLLVRIRDQRAGLDNGAPEGGWKSSWRGLFSRVEYLDVGGARELQLSVEIRGEDEALFTSPLPLLEHNVIAGATLAG